MLPIPVATETTLGRRAWTNGVLILANLAVFLWQQANPTVMGRFQLDIHSLNLSRFISYAFVHTGWMHLLLNMLMLYILGGNINRQLGQMGYLAFYLSGAVLAGVGFIASGGVAVVGASGAVGAVMGAYLVLLPRSNLTLFVGLGAIEVPSMYFVLIFFLYNLLMRLVTWSGVPQVAYMAHIAGMVGGFAMAMGLLIGRLLPRGPADFLALLAYWSSPQLRQEAERLGRLSLANRLAAQHRYAEAAGAYERFLAHDRQFERIEEVELMLGLIYSRYLGQYERARQCLEHAMERLQGRENRQMAQAELTRIGEIARS